MTTPDNRSYQKHWRRAATLEEALCAPRVLHETAAGQHIEDGRTAVDHHVIVGLTQAKSLLYVPVDADD